MLNFALDSARKCAKCANLPLTMGVSAIFICLNQYLTLLTDFVGHGWTLAGAIRRRLDDDIEKDSGTRLGWREQISPKLEAAFDADFECAYICIPNAIKDKGLVSSIQSEISYISN